MRALLPIAAAFTLLVVASPGAAQPLAERGYRGVEQIYGDVDPLARNLRNVEAGISEQGGQSTRVYRRKGQEDKLYYITPGVTASYDRSGYAWFRISKKQWMLFTLIPPNTVFHLGPPAPEPEPADPNAIRESRRVRGETQRVGVRVDARAHASRAGSEHAWRRYMAFTESQRRAVVEALDPSTPTR